MNIVLLLVLIALACGGFAARHSPQFLKACAAWLWATAEADQQRREVFEQRRTAHRREMGLPPREPRNVVVEMPERVL